MAKGKGKGKGGSKGSKRKGSGGSGTLRDVEKAITKLVTGR